MYPRSDRRRALWLVVAAAIGLLVFIAIGLVIEVAVGPHPKPDFSPPTPIPVPGESSSSPSASPAPALSGTLRVIQGRELVNGVYLGYPHSTQGAVSAADEFMTQIGSTLDPDRAAAVLRLTADPSYPAGPQAFAQGTISERKDLGLPAAGQVPTTASVVLDLAEYQARSVTAGQVTVLLLADDIITLPGQGTQTRIGVYPLRMHWAGGDWKILPPDTAVSYVSLDAEPGSPQAASSGWQELSQ